MTPSSSVSSPLILKPLCLKCHLKKENLDILNTERLQADFESPFSSNILENILEALKPLHWLPVRYVLNLKWLY